MPAFVWRDGASELVLHDDPDLPFEEIYYLVDDVRDLFRRREELKLTFVQSPKQVSRGYKAAVKDPFGTVLQLLDRTTESAAPASIEAGKDSGSLFPGPDPTVPAKRDVLAKMYVRVGRTADDLPYTPHFERLYTAYAAEHPDAKPTRRETWRHLLNLRKAGKLPKLGEAPDRPAGGRAGGRGSAQALIGPGIGKRDRLPYSEEFDKLVDTFNKNRQRPMSPHLVWRVVAKLAK